MFWRKKTTKPAEVAQDSAPSLYFSTDVEPPHKLDVLRDAMSRTFQSSAPVANGTGMDSMDSIPLKAAYSLASQNIPDVQFSWFASQGFIGHQTAAMIAQHWLVDKACTMPGKDAIRNGYEITVNDGTEVPPETLDQMRDIDKNFRINEQMLEFISMGRVFGIRIAMFLVDGIDYAAPFNPDGVKPGSYKGITQIDPYWLAPELSMDAASNPSATDFYEPTWWRVNGKRVHRSHLCIFRTGQLPDILKPTYLYGGIPIPQKIFERVYAAERTANEAPQLAMTKRTNTIHTDVGAALANQAEFENRMAQWSLYRDNYGVKVLGQDETAEQFDTSLADLDAVIMTQYQIVAAAANVPATKLLGTSPKGFNATGEFEMRSYHEELESIQTHDLTPFLDRHHLLSIRSFIGQDFSTTVVWKPLDAMTSAELATVNKTKAETDAILLNAGAIDGEDVRNRIISDPESGYTGIAPAEFVDVEETANEEASDLGG